MWLCLAPRALAAHARGAGPPSGRTRGGGESGGGSRSGARARAPQGRRQVRVAESLWVAGQSRARRVLREGLADRASARLLRAPDPPGLPGAAGLTWRLPTPAALSVG